MLDLLIWTLAGVTAVGWYRARRTRVSRSKELRATADAVASRIARSHLGLLAEPDFAETPVRRHAAMCVCRHAHGAHRPTCILPGCGCTVFRERGFCSACKHPDSLHRAVAADGVTCGVLGCGCSRPRPTSMPSDGERCSR